MLPFWLVADSLPVIWMLAVLPVWVISPKAVIDVAATVLMPPMIFKLFKAFSLPMLPPS